MPPKGSSKANQEPSDVKQYLIFEDDYAAVQDACNKAVKSLGIKELPVGYWQYVIKPRLRLPEDKLHDFLWADKDYTWKDLSVGIQHLAKEFAKDTKNPEPVSEKTIHQYCNDLNQAFMYAMGIEEQYKGSRSPPVINPKQEGESNRWHWVTQVKKVKEGLDKAAKASSNALSYLTQKNKVLTVFARDWLGGDMRGFALYYEQEMAVGSYQVAKVGKEQLPSDQQLDNLPLPHEMLLNKLKLHEYASAFYPHNNKLIKDIGDKYRAARKMQEKKPNLQNMYHSSYNDLWNLLFGNFVYQMVDYDDSWVFRNQNLYTVQILYPGEDTPTSGDVNFMRVDPAKRNQNIEIIHNKFKTAEKVKQQQKRQRQFEGPENEMEGTTNDDGLLEHGLKVIVIPGSKAHQAFWATYDLTGRRQYLIPKFLDPTQPRHQFDAGFMKHTWVLDEKVPTFGDYRTSKQMIQLLHSITMTKAQKEKLHAMSFQGQDAPARTAYEKPALAEDYQNSYRLANQDPSKGYVFITGTKDNTSYNQKYIGLAKDILSSLGRSSGMKAITSTDPEDIFKPALITPDNYKDDIKKRKRLSTPEEDAVEDAFELGEDYYSEDEEEKSRPVKTRVGSKNKRKPQEPTAATATTTATNTNSRVTRSRAKDAQPQQSTAEEVSSKESPPAFTENALTKSEQEQLTEDVIEEMNYEETPERIEEFAERYTKALHVPPNEPLNLQEKTILWRMNYAMEQFDNLQKMQHEGDRSFYRYDILPGEYDPFTMIMISPEEEADEEHSFVDFKYPVKPPRSNRGRKPKNPKKEEDNTPLKPLFWLRLKPNKKLQEEIEQYTPFQQQFAMLWQEFTGEKLLGKQLMRYITVIPIYYVDQKENVQRLLQEQAKRNRMVRRINWLQEEGVDEAIVAAVAHAEVAGLYDAKGKKYDIKEYKKLEGQLEEEENVRKHWRKKKPGRKPLPWWMKKTWRDKPFWKKRMAEAAERRAEREAAKAARLQARQEKLKKKEEDRVRNLDIDDIPLHLLV